MFFELVLLSGRWFILGWTQFFISEIWFWETVPERVDVGMTLMVTRC